MSFPLQRHWPGVALLAAGLLLGAPLLVTWGNGQLIRHLLRDQSQGLESDPMQPWRLEIEELAGGLSATVCRFQLYAPRYSGLRLEVAGRLQHRLLTTSFAGDVYLLAGSQGSSGQRPAHLQGLASFHGQARYQPVFGVVWSTRVQGESIHFAVNGLKWTLGPWAAIMTSDRAPHLRLTLPLLKREGKQLGVASIRGAELELEIDAPAHAVSWSQLRGHAQAEALELRFPQGLADASGLVLEGHLQREPDGWPFSLQLSAAELVYKGFPFTRVSNPSYRLEGQVEPVGGSVHPVAVSSDSALRWRSIQSLEGDSDYGPLRGDALATGTLDSSGVLSLSELRLIGLLPQGLWSVLERLNAELAAYVVEAGLVHPDGKQVPVRAEYRGGQWHALVAGP